MEISYRTPVSEEAAAFAALHVTCWREAYKGLVPPELMASFSADQRLPLWQAALANPACFVLGAFDGDRPVGFLMSGPAEENYIPDQEAHLWALYIAAAQHRRGIGRRLLGAAARHWLAQGGHSLTVGVLLHNQPARAFYEACGAELVKTGSYEWAGHVLPECLYIWRDLTKIANFC